MINCFKNRGSKLNDIIVVIGPCISQNSYEVKGDFKTKFLLNDFCLKHKKFLVTGAISKFDGHIFTFDFK